MIHIITTICYIIAIVVGYFWLRNPTGKIYEPIAFIFCCIAATILLIPKIVNMFRKKSKYDPAKIDKYLAIHDSIKKYIAKIMTEGRIDYKQSMQMLKDTKHADVIFPDNTVKKYIKILYNKGIKLENIEYKIDRTYDDVKRKDILNKREELFNWFTQQHNVINEMFKPYLNINT
ncbi:hypothetical protein KAR91_36530 [Candidatus Pacearchaeota archaeon]|nr:hypothetical protein [Candidatus Pacearchaeota archaeon]